MFGTHPSTWFVNMAGALMFVAGLVAFLGIITAETLYPGYSVSENEISDLGATRPPNSIIEQPSSNIFSGSMIVAGLMVIVAALFIYRVLRSRVVTVPVGLFGLGVLGVGVFNGSWGGVGVPGARVRAGVGGYLMGTVPLDSQASQTPTSE